MTPVVSTENPNLPKPLGNLDPPEYISPSLLSPDNKCRLSIWASSGTMKRNRPLPQDPKAALGILAHEVLEEITKQPPLPGWDEAKYREIFSATLERISRQIAIEAINGKSIRLRDTIDPAHWAQVGSWVRSKSIERWSSAYTPGSPHRTSSGQGEIHPSQLQVGVTFTEMTLQAPRLGLRGRVDWLKRVSTNHYEIGDYKTGNPIGIDGKPKLSVRVQLNAYAVLLRELVPGAKITLQVASKDSFAWTFDVDSDSEAVLGRLGEILPDGVSGISAAELAEPGPSCINCAWRPRCSSYLSTAPSLWLSMKNQTGSLPMDIWGEVHSIRDTLHGVCLDIRDSAGRMCQVKYLSRGAWATGISQHADIWLFSLRPTGGLRPWGKEHPKQYFEISPDIPKPGWAWTSALYF